jgi:4'-phosphopantetheinyl transferase EntD
MYLPLGYKWGGGRGYVSSSSKRYTSFPTTAVGTGGSNITQKQQDQQQKHSFATAISSKSAPTKARVLPPEVEKWLDVTLPEGRCVGVRITMGDKFSQFLSSDDDCDKSKKEEPSSNCTSSILPQDHWMHTLLHPDEINYGVTTLKQSRVSFWLGRLALRVALDFPDYPILRDSHGRPQLPPCKNPNNQHGHVFGSISHKQDRGVALVSSGRTIAPSGNGVDDNLILAGVGVDLEMTSRPDGKLSIAKRILTQSEQQSMGNLPRISLEEEVLLRFSLKEAIYKASHPLLRQYVGFQEAEVTPLADGTATCRWLLATGTDCHWMVTLKVEVVVVLLEKTTAATFFS